MADETTTTTTMPGVVAAVSAPQAPVVPLPAIEKPGTADATASGKQAEEVRAFTQQELDRIVAERLARQKQQYADYAELKDKATKWAAYEEAQKTEAQKQQELLTKLQLERDNALQVANDRLIRAAFLAESAKLGVLHPGDVYALADLAGVAIDERGIVQGATEAVKAVVDAGRVPLQAQTIAGTARQQPGKLDGGAGTGNKRTDATATLTDEELAIAQRLGINPEKYLARRKEVQATRQ
jgi:hypothetical protein